MNHYQLIIGRRENTFDTNSSQKSYLDTFQSESISLNYNIADINDLSNKNSSYSKTIKLPNTKNNQAVFSNIWSLDFNGVISPGQYFNPNIKEKCYILKDNVIQFEGNLQLTNIEYDINLRNIVYSVVIYSENDGLFKSIGEKFLSDLDLNRFNHKWTGNNIYNSWTASYGIGYFYPMIDYGTPLSMNRDFRPIDFKPAMYIKTIWNQIFAEAGYSFESDFLNSDYFSHIVMPYSNKTIAGSIDLALGPKKEVIRISQNISKIWSYTASTPSTTTGIYYQQGQSLYHAGYMIGDFSNFNPSNLYNFTQSYFQNTNTGRYAARLVLNIGQIRTKLDYTNNPPSTPWDQFGGPFGDFRIFVMRSRGSTSFGPTGSVFNVFGIQAPTPPNTRTWQALNFAGSRHYSLKNNPQGLNVTYSPSTKEWIYSGTITTDLAIDPNTIQEDEKIMIWFGFDGIQTPRQTLGALISSTIKVNQMTFDIIYDDTIAVENGAITISKILPNMKQMDFVSNIIRMFNLYIEPKKNSDKVFIIEPRDDYFNKYKKVKDWSQKIDLTKSISADIPSNLQARLNTLTYKQDKDYYNQQYETITNTIFGEYKFEFQNEFSTSEKKIEVIFSPTPTNLLPQSNSMYIPTIVGNNNGNLTNLNGFNARILYVENIGLTQGDTWRFWKNGYLSGTSSTQNSYPFASFANDPLTPDKSLNFGRIIPLYDGYTDTQNNLYYTYYQNTFFELNNIDSRVVDAYFNLTPYDISDFRFSDIIYMSIDNMAGYYRVNKIIDYDPSKYQSTKVQLVKVLNYSLDLELPPGSCDVQIQYCLCGDNLQGYLDNISSFIDPSGVDPFLVWKLSNDDNYYPFTLPEFGPILADTIADWFNTIPGASASYTPGDSSCILNFEVEMGEEAANTFIGSINEYYDDNPGTAYLAIYLDYPCGATFGTWVEDDNVYFLTVEEGFTQYTFLDWWLNNIDGAYGTASGEPLAEGAYLQLGWNWETSCLTASNATQSFSISIILDESQTESFIEQVNNAYISGDYIYVSFLFNYPDTPVPYDSFYTIPNATQSITDITTWFNSNLPGASASTIDGITTFEINWEYLCDICYKEYTFKINLANDLFDPLDSETLFFNTTTAPCISDCEGTGLNLKVCFSNVDYLPGGWTPELFCDGPLLEDGSGPVFEAGGLTYGESQDICVCVGDTLCFEYNTSFECPGGLVTLENYIGSNTSYEENIETLWSVSDGCICEDNPTNQIAQLEYQEQSTGFRAPLPFDNAALVGVINTSSDNLVTAPNNIVIGENNSVYASNNLILGTNNTNIIGGNNFIMGASISTNDTSNKPSILIGENIQSNNISGVFIFGDNITLERPLGVSGSTASIEQPENLFIIGNNLNLGGSQSLPSNTTFLGTENIILSNEGGFNPPFIISENDDYFSPGLPSIVYFPNYVPPPSAEIKISGRGFVDNQFGRIDVYLGIGDVFGEPYYIETAGGCWAAFSYDSSLFNNYKLGEGQQITIELEIRTKMENYTYINQVSKFYAVFVNIAASPAVNLAQVSTTDQVIKDGSAGDIVMDLDEQTFDIHFSIENNFASNDKLEFYWFATLKYSYI
jgi:hypothetical protein